MLLLLAHFQGLMMYSCSGCHYCLHISTISWCTFAQTFAWHPLGCCFEESDEHDAISLQLMFPFMAILSYIQYVLQMETDERCLGCITCMLKYNNFDWWNMGCCNVRDILIEDGKKLSIGQTMHRICELCMRRTWWWYTLHTVLRWHHKTKQKGIIYT